MRLVNGHGNTLNDAKKNQPRLKMQLVDRCLQLVPTRDALTEVHISVISNVCNEANGILAIVAERVDELWEGWFEAG